ncbi:MAG: hypothetical protein R3336_07060 [Phycisphaeraceae bacterium]|nr:hypothetical protein [Phycisphaeraceae bacterium]
MRKRLPKPELFLRPILCLLLLTAPGTLTAAEPEETPDNDAGARYFITVVEAAHNEEAWSRKKAVVADLTVRFGGKTRLEGTMRFTPGFRAAEITRADGATAGWRKVRHATDAWISPKDAEFPRGRFHVLTWSYFLAAPFKLDDPGTRLEALGLRPLTPERHSLVPAARLTFDEHVGDTPDDWYIVYRQPDTDRLLAMAYIVTYGKAKENAEKEPHAVRFRQFKKIDGVVLPTHWTFHHWSEEKGLYGEPMGEVILRNIHFPDDVDRIGHRPGDSRDAPLPPAAEDE